MERKQHLPECLKYAVSNYLMFLASNKNIILKNKCETESMISTNVIKPKKPAIKLNKPPGKLNSNNNKPSILKQDTSARKTVLPSYEIDHHISEHLFDTDI